MPADFANDDSSLHYIILLGVELSYHFVLSLILSL